MGLFSKLQNGDTVLKSLKFGNDRPGGGNSGQPYIKNPLIDEPGKLSRVDDDFLLRGGLRAPINAAEDVTRLTKYMFDFKSPKGLMFIAKQNLLSRVSVATEASISAGYGNNPSKELAWTKCRYDGGHPDIMRLTGLPCYTFHTFILERLMAQYCKTKKFRIIDLFN